jgi:hypothetical protein
MGILTVRCPNTGDTVSTGVVVDEDAFAQSSFEPQRFRCDACGDVHAWDRADASFRPDPGP